MLNQNSLLTELFTNIADTIRSKTNITDTIVAGNFPIVIENIETTDEATARMKTAQAQTTYNRNQVCDLIERKMTEITIPNNVTSIGSYAFNGCSKLTKITIPDTVTKINDAAFSYCPNLTELVFPESIEVLGIELIAGTPIKTVVVPKNIKFGNSCFRNATIETFIVENGATTLPIYCCSNCKSLKTVSLPNTLQSAKNSPFGGCTALEFVTLEQGFNCDGLNLSSSTLYSVETLVAMLEALEDLTGQKAKTLTIGSANLAKLTEEQIAIATNKNWTLA
jgi:hypothetical protein